MGWNGRALVLGGRRRTGQPSQNGAIAKKSEGVGSAPGKRTEGAMQ